MNVECRLEEVLKGRVTMSATASAGPQTDPTTTQVPGLPGNPPHLRMPENVDATFPNMRPSRCKVGISRVASSIARRGEMVVSDCGG